MISEETLWDYVDGALDETLRKAIAQAIADDSHVAAKYKDVMALHQQLQMQAVETPPVHFTARVMNAVNGAPAFTTARKISVLPVIGFALPLLLLMLAACIVLSNNGILHPLSFQINPGIWNNLRFYSILADVVLLLLFIETWYSRFKNTFV